MKPEVYNEIQDCIFLNYEDLRNQLILKYNNYQKIRKDHASIFDIDITKQFVDMVQAYVTLFVTQRSLINTEDVKLYVEDKFTFDNIERIISEDGKI